MSHKFAKFMHGFSAWKPCPEIRWQDVVLIEAMGTDAFSAFQIWLTFYYSDGSKEQVAVEMKGYWDVVKSLHTRFPAIPPNWYDEMSEQTDHVERILFSKDEAVV
jgi:hypothetical protein